MSIVIKKSIALVILLFVVAVIVRSSLFHFDTEIIENKRKRKSPQRHWNVGYGINYVFVDSPLRYQNDLVGISKVIEPGYSLLSDLATSYYAAATLPVYILNAHEHQSRGEKRIIDFKTVLQKGNFCYLDDKFHRKAALDFLEKDMGLARKKGWPLLRYVLLNKDKQNSMLRDECLTLRSDQIESSLLTISQLIYEGEYLNLYQLDTFFPGS